MKILTILSCLPSEASAAQLGDFTYTDNGTSITIDAYPAVGTGYPTAGTGVVDIPTTIDGKPVTMIGNNAFQSCAGLTCVTIPSSVTNIGAFAFYGCSGLTNVTIPAANATIGAYAFKNCTALAAVGLPSGLAVVELEVFNGCGGLASVTIPAGVTNIKDSAFKGCKSLTSITIPSGVTTVGTGVFSNCAGLVSVVIPSSVTAISIGMFSSCSGLTSVVIEGAVTIGNNAFEYCTQLASLTIPDTVTSIGKSAFISCKGLTSIHIPALVATIGTPSTPNAFANCIALTTISVDPANPNFSGVGGVLMDKLQTKLITCPGGLSGAFSIPSTVTTVGVSAFVNCSKLTSVTFPSGVTGIGSQAFSNCITLASANFTGNAPLTMSGNVFEVAAPGFAIYYSDATTGFTSPTWYGYPAFSVASEITPMESWLISKGLPANSDIQSDANGDGVNLLMAYALNLNPNQNLSGSVPRPVMTADQMSLSFYSGAAGVAYVVECSSDMAFWSTSGVTISAPDENQIRTAAVSRSGSSCFMRLVVSH